MKNPSRLQSEDIHFFLYQRNFSGLRKRGNVFPRVDRPSGDRLARLIGSSGVFTGLSLSSLKTPVFLPLCCFSLMAFPEILPPKPSSFTTSLLDFISRRSGSSSMSNDSIYTSLYRNISAGTSPSTDLNSLYTSFTSTLRARRQTSRTISTCRFDATVSYIGANWEIFKNYRRPHY